MSSFTMGTVFEGMRLMTSLNIKEDLQNLVLEQSNGKTKRSQEQFGYIFLMTVLERASQKGAENQIYSFLSKVLNKEINAESNPDEVITDLTTFADAGEWKSFFIRVANLIITK